MKFTYIDSQQDKFTFTINEDNLFVEIECVDKYGNYFHRDYVRIYEDLSLGWYPYHTRDMEPIVSKDARLFCERIVKSFYKMKVFW